MSWATYSSEQVIPALLQAELDSIALLNINQPTNGTAEGVNQAILILREQGFEFFLLENKQLH